MKKIFFNKYDQVEDRVNEYKDLEIRNLSSSEVRLVWKINEL